jgi:hypothetical protein
MATHRHSHIVPASYLRAWARNDLVGVGWSDGSPKSLLAPSVIGVRSGFYRERLPDGTTSDWLDPAMGALENEAIQIIRTIDDRWPVTGEDRGRLGEFVALQLTRTPAWRNWYGRALENSVQTLLAENPDRSRDALGEAIALMSTDSERHLRIVNNLAGIGTLFANMHWSLLRCGAPRLVTSDHPVVPVPFGEAPLREISAVPLDGLFATSEFRLALTPQRLLLMTWWDNFAPEPTARMHHRHVRNHNSVVMAQGDRQWFHHPALPAERGPGPWNPISFELYESQGYYPQSLRWQIVNQAVTEIDGEPEPRTGLRLIDWEATLPVVAG